MTCRRLLVASIAATLQVSCGEGIALDPTSTKSQDSAVGQGAGGDAAGDPAMQADINATDAIGAPEDVDGSIAIDAGGDAARDSWMDPRSDRFGEAGPDVSLDGRGDSLIDAADQDAMDSQRASDGGFDTRDATGSSTDGTTDAAHDVPSRDVDDGCTSACWPAADYYVDASAPLGGNGSRLQPFKTITAAIEAFGVDGGVAKKAYVATGTYDEALGERFPLFLRGLSLEGAGPDRTFIVGTGTLDHSAEGGVYPSQYPVTVVIGDRLLPSNLARVSVRPVSPVPADDFRGVFCDRGNATGEVASPGGQTHLDQVTVGPGYVTGVTATTSTWPSITGCNMAITRSTITGDTGGVEAIGCDGSVPAAPVIFEMGNDDPASGNTVSWIQSNLSSGIGVHLGPCVIRASFLHNTFVDSINGIMALGGEALHFPPHAHPHLIFKHNVFQRLSASGLTVSGFAYVIDEISDNHFVDVSKRFGDRFPWSAHAVDFSLTDVKKFRRNQFTGNDVGVFIVFLGDGPPTDFGTVDDPGDNVFRCNSALAGAGGDVIIERGSDDPSSNWAGTIRFAGTAWDRVPPTVQTTHPPANGIDIAVRDSPNVNLDRANAIVSTAACPSGRVPGP